MEERTEYRLTPNFNQDSNPSMVLQYCDYRNLQNGTWVPIWRSVPKYVKTAEGRENLGLTLMSHEMRIADSPMDYHKYATQYEVDYMPVEFDLDTAITEGREFQEKYRNIKSYFHDVIGSYLEAEVERIYKDTSLTDEEKMQKAQRLADKNAHRVTYL